MSDKSNKSSKLKLIEIIMIIVISAALIGIGIKVKQYLIETKPKPKRRPAAAQTPLVKVEKFSTISHKVVISAMGTVIPAKEFQINARVTGEVIEKNPSFVQGGLIRKGQSLIKIDPADYKLSLINAQSQLETAKYELTIEQGQQDVAKREWELLDMKDISSELDKELALRKPHLLKKQAALKAAGASVAKVELDLSRTNISAPSNAIVSTANVEIGELVQSQTVIAQLIGTDAYWIEATVPVDRLAWINFPEKNNPKGAPVEVTLGSGAKRKGYVLRLLSDIEPNGRLARILVEVTDPLELKNTSETKSPMLLGDYVHLNIEGPELNNVFEIPVTALRNSREIWTVDSDDRLKIITPRIVWKNKTSAFIESLGDETQLIVSDLSAPVENMEVQIIGKEKKPSKDKKTEQLPPAKEVADKKEDSK